MKSVFGCRTSGKDLSFLVHVTVIFVSFNTTEIPAQSPVNDDGFGDFLGSRATGFPTGNMAVDSSGSGNLTSVIAPQGAQGQFAAGAGDQGSNVVMTSNVSVQPDISTPACVASVATSPTSKTPPKGNILRQDCLALYSFLFNCC